MCPSQTLPGRLPKNKPRGVEPMIRVIAAFVVLLGVLPGLADEPPAKPFNGHDLAGWKFRGDVTRSEWYVGVAALDPRNPARIDIAPGVPEAEKELVNTFRNGRSID